MAIVKDFYIGTAHIMIDDTYCRDKTPEEVKAIYDKIAKDTYPILLRKHMREMEKLAKQAGNANNNVNEPAAYKT